MSGVVICDRLLLVSLYSYTGLMLTAFEDAAEPGCVVAKMLRLAATQDFH